MVFFCQFCSFSSLHWRQVLRHTFEAHSNVPGFNFTCGVAGCPQTFQTYSAVTSHLRRKHRGRDFDDQAASSYGVNAVTETEEDTSSRNNDVDASPGSELCPQVNRLEKAAALFLLCLKERYQITQTALDFAMSQVQQMVGFAIEDVQQALELQLQSSYYLKVLWFLIHFFIEKSEYMQTKYYKENFNLIVSFFAMLVCVCNSCLF